MARRRCRGFERRVDTELARKKASKKEAVVSTQPFSWRATTGKKASRNSVSAPSTTLVESTQHRQCAASRTSNGVECWAEAVPVPVPCPGNGKRNGYRITVNDSQPPGGG